MKKCYKPYNLKIKIVIISKGGGEKKIISTSLQ